MPDGRYRVLVVNTHPVQYVTPLLRLMAQHPKLDPLIVYCSLQGVERGLDPEFGVEVAWNVPLLDGYPWVQIPNRALRPGLGRFLGLVNPGLWRLVRTGRFDCIYVSGYYYASAWIAIAAAKRFALPVILSTDAHALASRNATSPARQMLKRAILPPLWRMADVVLAGSTGTVEYLSSLGYPRHRIVLVKNVVDNDWWMSQAERADREVARRSWRIPCEAPIVLFCAKLQPWKRPQDLLRAFVRANVPGAYLVYAGEGPLRGALEAEGKALGVAGRVRFLGFVNQSQLPAVYRASDLLVLPSEYEPFGLVVNEAMLCGCAVAVSDRVGARFDLVHSGVTGSVFPCGDVDALAGILREALGEPTRLQQLIARACERMATWSPRDNNAAFVEAVEKATALRRGQKRL